MSDMITGSIVQLNGKGDSSYIGSTTFSLVPQRWEYLTAPSRGGGSSSTILNVFGRQGWELVAVSGGLMFFKRKVL